MLTHPLPSPRGPRPIYQRQRFHFRERQISFTGGGGLRASSSLHDQSGVA